METSCASLRVSHSSQCSYQEAFTIVGQQGTFHLGCNTETVATITQSFHGCESLQMGSPSQTGRTAVSWSLDSRPISSSYHDLEMKASTEWSLDQTICNSILSVTIFPNIDLFATRLKLPLYVSPSPDEKALAIDAMSMNWNGMRTYAFPPFALISAIISKIRQHHCNIVLIAPLWAEMSWFPDILRLIVALVIQIPSHKNLLTRLGQKFVRENVGSLKRHTWSYPPIDQRSNVFGETCQTGS